jgi:hypothetical protein
MPFHATPNNSKKRNAMPRHAMPQSLQISRHVKAYIPYIPYAFLPAGVVCNALSSEALAGLLQALADESVLWHNTAALI